MTRVTATDFKQNLGRYLRLARKETIHITKNGEDIAILTAPEPTPSWVDGISGILRGADVDEKQVEAGRLADKHESLS